MKTSGHTGRWAKLLIAVIAVVTVLGAGVNAQRASAGYPVRGMLNVWGAQGNPQRCLDFDYWSPRNGGKVQQWQCLNDAEQRWQQIPEGCDYTGCYFELKSVYDGQCLDADLNTIGRNGGVIQQWGCNNQYNQLWKWINSNGSTAALQSRWAQGVGGNMCLDFDLNTPGNGGRVQQWTCNNWNNQRWYL